MVLMPETEIDVAARIAERVRQSVEADLFEIEKGARRIPVTVSVGLAQSLGETEAEALFRRADRALYRSKNEGRNRVTLDAA